VNIPEYPYLGLWTDSKAATVIISLEYQHVRGD
jgi:hypothetical protein